MLLRLQEDLGCICLILSPRLVRFYVEPIISPFLLGREVDYIVGRLANFQAVRPLYIPVLLLTAPLGLER